MTRNLNLCAELDAAYGAVSLPLEHVLYQLQMTKRLYEESESSTAMQLITGSKERVGMSLDSGHRSLSRRQGPQTSSRAITMWFRYEL